MGLTARLLDWIEGDDIYEDEAYGAQGAQPAAALRENASLTLMMLRSVPEAHQIADRIAEGKTVIFSIAATPRALARRLVDVVGGALYARDAQIERIATDTFLAAPAEVDIYSPDV